MLSGMYSWKLAKGSKVPIDVTAEGVLDTKPSCPIVHLSIICTATSLWLHVRNVKGFD